MQTSILNENIWEVKQWPKHGANHDFYEINDIYFYNSLTSFYEDKQQSAYIQIPESLIGNREEEYIVWDNLLTIIKNKIPVIRRINDETWVVDLTLFRGKCG